MKTVHRVCYYLLKMKAVERGDGADIVKCLECPAWEPTSHGRGKKMCRGFAEEVVNIVKVGNPWGCKKRSHATWPKKPKTRNGKRDAR